ncbi:MAG: hypothetical protein QN159_02085 [Armatimonadota bacterium]|nr:hypothetical protein [Armatimonadota bacterium]
MGPELRMPILLGVLLVVLAALLVRGAWGRDVRFEAAGSDVLVGLLVLAALALGAFLTYALVRP